MKLKIVPVRVFGAGYDFVTFSLVEHTFNPGFLGLNRECRYFYTSVKWENSVTTEIHVGKIYLGSVITNWNGKTSPKQAKHLLDSITDNIDTNKANVNRKIFTKVTGS